MSDGNMTIKEVKSAKKTLEHAIMLLMQEFEDDTGVHASYVSVQRKNDDESALEPERPERRGRIDSVEVSMDLDLIL